MSVQEKSPEDQWSKLIFQMCDGASVMQGGHCTWTDVWQMPTTATGVKGSSKVCGRGVYVKEIAGSNVFNFIRNTIAKETTFPKSPRFDPELQLEL